MAHDTIPRYAPSTVIQVRQGKWGLFSVTDYIVHPPGHKSPVIRDDLTALECKTDLGSRWFGCDRAYINSELRMVIVGFDDRDEVRRKWEVCNID